MTAILMKKSVVPPEEFQRLLLACAALPFLPADRWVSDYMNDLMLTMLDFHMQGSAVAQGVNYFREQVQRPHGIETHAQLTDCLAGFPDTWEGNRQASQFLWNNQHGVRAECLRRLLTFFASVGVTDQPSLHTWARHAEFERDFKGKVKGLGIAVFHWLQIRCGVSTIKPDVWVIKFVQRVLGRRLSEKALVALFHEIAPLVGESLNVIDATIWHYERRAMATKDVPEWRVVGWMLLKGAWERALKEAPFNRVNWDVELDEKASLRYDAAGLAMTGDRSFLGQSVRGITTLMLLQSVWNEGLTLTLWVCHDKALSAPQWKRLRTRLSESAWAVSNDSVFEASWVAGDNMMMSDMTLEKLNAWVEKSVARWITALREWVA
jgi:hypothetical protein